MTREDYPHDRTEYPDEDNECRHGYPRHEWCPLCALEADGCDRYHQLKDDGYFIKDDDDQPN